MIKIKELEQNFLRKIYKVSPDYSIDFKWHIFLVRIIMLYPFLLLIEILTVLTKSIEKLTNIISEVFPSFYTVKKKTDK